MNDIPNLNIDMGADTNGANDIKAAARKAMAMATARGAIDMMFMFIEAVKDPSDPTPSEAKEIATWDGHMRGVLSMAYLADIITLNDIEELVPREHRAFYQIVAALDIIKASAIDATIAKRDGMPDDERARHAEAMLAACMKAVKRA